MKNTSPSGKSVIVVNLETGVEMLFVGISPEAAVVAAYESETRKNRATWTYDPSVKQRRKLTTQQRPILTRGSG